jgi:GR25 family glycosyltransferase involved in LPS biosynthesis
MGPCIDAVSIVVVNLDRSADALAAFRTRNAHLGPVRRFPAVAGADADRAGLRASGVIAGDLNYTDGALGCALSHLRLWRDVAHATRALTVCEDDAVFAADFLTIANARLAALPQGWDIVLWGWNFDSSLVFEVLPGHPAFLTHRERTPSADDLAAAAGGPAAAQLFRLKRACGTLCYTVSPAGAARLLTFCTPLRPLWIPVPEVAGSWPNRGIDLMMSALYAQIQAYVAVPPLAISPNVVSDSTTRLVVTGGLERRVVDLPLVSLVRQIDEVAASPRTEVELYRAWILANEGSDLLYAAWFNLAGAFARADDYESAIVAYQNVLVLRPGFEPASAALGAVLRRSAELGCARCCGDRRSSDVPGVARPGAS